MRLKPDKYHPRRLFQLNGDGKPYKFIYGNTELLVATALFAAGIFFFVLIMSGSHLPGILHEIRSLIYLFFTLICPVVSFYILLEHILNIGMLRGRREYYPDRIVYYINEYFIGTGISKRVVAKIPAPRKVLETLEKEELVSIKIAYKLKEIKYYQNQAENTLEHIKNLPTITETSVLIDDYQHAHQWYLKKAEEAEKWVADMLLKRAEDKEENEKRVEGIEKAVKEQTMF